MNKNENRINPITRNAKLYNLRFVIETIRSQTIDVSQNSSFSTQQFNISSYFYKKRTYLDLKSFSV